MQVLADRGCEIFLEIGPSPTLIAMGRRCLMQEDYAWLPSLRPRPGAADDWQTMLESLGQLYVRGAKIDWAGFDRARVPGYPREGGGGFRFPPIPSSASGTGPA